MSHRYHPDPTMGDNPDAILFDDCLDCEAHTERLGVSLDSVNWSRMFRRMLVTEVIKYRHIFASTKLGYRSENERKLTKQMYYMYVALERQHWLEGSTMDSVVYTLTGQGV